MTPVMVRTMYDNTYWFIKGTEILHREDGPAMIWPDGSEAWYQHGKRHREGGPAVSFANGYKEWWVHGKRHRIDGPAIINSAGDRFWYIENEHIVDTKLLEFIISKKANQ